ncbi:MAG: putative DNA-binding domain-containing protein [Candidatus Thiodiazotropha sp.]
MHCSNRPEAGFQALQHRFADCIRQPSEVEAPQGVAAERMAIYCELFFNNVESFLADSFPVLRSLLTDGQWQSMVRDFYSRHACRTPLFTRLGEEFIGYLRDERERGEGDPPFLVELAHYEWVELALALSEAEALPVEPATHDLMRTRVRLSPLAWPLHYRYPVHRIGPQSQEVSAEAGGVHLLVYRNHDDEVVFLDLDPLTYSLLVALQTVSDASVSELLEALAEIARIELSDAFINRGLEVFSMLCERGVIGCLPSAESSHSGDCVEVGFSVGNEVGEQS